MLISSSLAWLELIISFIIEVTAILMSIMTITATTMTTTMTMAMTTTTITTTT